MTKALSDLVAEGIGSTTLAWPDDDASVGGGELADAARRHFADTADAECVGMLMSNDRPTVEVVLGALLAGTPVVSLPLPGRGADISSYSAFLLRVSDLLGLDEVVVSDAYADVVASTGVGVRRHSELTGRPLASPSRGGFSLVQFTSGSTGPPSPVRVTDAHLGANVGAMLEALRPGPGDGVVSWLPLAHDMGLIGMLFTGVAASGPAWADGTFVVLLNPTTFLRSPNLWLEALDRWRATFTAAPDFGYRHALRRPSSRPLDLSTLRCAIVGGEIVRADTLETFADALSPQGLSGRALCPAYGMAEAGLAVTMTRPDDEWRSTTLSTARLAEGEVVAAAPGTVEATTLVASGSPLRGYGVGAGSGTDAGSIRIAGPSLGSHGVTGRPVAGPDGWYETGDVGFVDDGAVYVCGRRDDYVVARGRNVYAPALDSAASAVAGVRAGRVVAVGLPDGDWVIVAEPEPGRTLTSGDRQRLRREIARSAVEVCAARPDSVVLVEPGSLPLTSSGKLQRQRTRAALVAGDLPTI